MTLLPPRQNHLGSGLDVYLELAVLTSAVAIFTASGLAMASMSVVNITCLLSHST